MEMLMRHSPFTTGVLTRAQSREQHSGGTFPTINQPLGQPEEEAIYDMDSGFDVFTG
jgi:hypothetical protein